MSKKTVSTAYKNIRSEAEKKGRLRAKYFNSKGKETNIRNHHLTTDKIEKIRTRYKEFIKNVPKEIKEKAGPNFFNPYREKGVYFGCVQALFMLGSNEWFPYKKVEEMIQNVMTVGMLPDKEGKRPWDKFFGKSERTGASLTRDYIGRIQHNMRVLQRINIDNDANPYGYKLAQVCACIDIKVDVDKQEYYKLNTNWDNVNKVKPLYLIVKKEEENKEKQKE